MILQDFKTIEHLVTDESFLNFYFQHNETDGLDWEDWQAENPERHALVKEAFLFIDCLSLKFDETQVKEKLRDFQLRFKEKDIVEPLKQARRINSPLQRVLKMAAAVAVLIVAVLFIFNKNIKNIAKNAFYTEGGISLTSQYVENKSIAKVSVYELSDGSIVRLNTGSSIRLAADYGKNSRDLYLEGEAYFEVAKDASKPFRVYASHSVTTALGTAFTVRAIKGETAVKIILLEGKVRVENTQKSTPSVELTSKQQILMETGKISPVENIANIDALTRWKDGYVMTFRETAFTDVIRTLSANYKTPITGFEHTQLANAKITAEFDKTTPLLSVMEALAFANGFTFIEKNDTLFLNN